MSDHAHPTMIAGHPFKGATVLSTGILLNPEMARFQIATPILFAPPNPEKVHDYRAPNSQIPSFGSFFAAYFGGHSYNLAS